MVRRHPENGDRRRCAQARIKSRNVNQTQPYSLASLLIYKQLIRSARVHKNTTAQNQHTNTRGDKCSQLGSTKTHGLLIVTMVSQWPRGTMVQCQLELAMPERAAIESSLRRKLDESMRGAYQNLVLRRLASWLRGRMSFAFFCRGPRAGAMLDFFEVSTRRSGT